MGILDLCSAQADRVEEILFAVGEHIDVVLVLALASVCPLECVSIGDRIKKKSLILSVYDHCSMEFKSDFWCACLPKLFLAAVQH